MSESYFPDELYAADKLSVDVILSADGRRAVEETLRQLTSQDLKNFITPKVKFLYCLPEWKHEWDQ